MKTKKTEKELQKQIDEMLEAAKPLMKWLNENWHPHSVIQVTHTHAELDIYIQVVLEKYLQR